MTEPGVGNPRLARGAGFAESYALGPARVQFQNEDPRGWREFAEGLGAHSAQGAALTQRGDHGHFARCPLFLGKQP